MKFRKLMVILSCLLVLSACMTDKERAQELLPKEEAQTEEVFQYIHDPSQNPEPMKDIIADPKAVYGFVPDPASDRLGEFASYDWSDEGSVASAKAERLKYHESMDSMSDIIYKMREEGASTEEIARAVSAERNRLRLLSYGDDIESLEKIKESNKKTYGQEEGPTPDQLFEKYGSWALVIQKAFAPNLGMDAVCGLYDDYYWLYVELGLAENDAHSQ